MVVVDAVVVVVDVLVDVDDVVEVVVVAGAVVVVVLCVVEVVEVLDVLDVLVVGDTVEVVVVGGAVVVVVVPPAVVVVVVGAPGAPAFGSGSPPLLPPHAVKNTETHKPKMDNFEPVCIVASFNKRRRPFVSKRTLRRNHHSGTHGRQGRRALARCFD